MTTTVDDRALDELLRFTCKPSTLRPQPSRTTSRTHCRPAPPPYGPRNDRTRQCSSSRSPAAASSRWTSADSSRWTTCDRGAGRKSKGRGDFISADN